MIVVERKPARREHGASMVLVTFSLLMLMGAAAIAVDLAAMRLDRSADQKVTDSAASAGALAALDGTGRDACESALAYVAINAQEIGSIDDSGCATSFPSASCDPANPLSHTPPLVGRFVITVTYPVPNNHALMTSAQIGAPTQALVADDGDPCERVAVQMSATHESLFAQLIGFDQGTTTVHTVATAFLPSLDGPPLNLLVLDRYGTEGCGAIVVQGNGGVIVEKVVDPVTGDEFPGVAAADSDASAGCDAVDPSVLRVDGSNSLLRADGPAGCPSELSPGTGWGCGLMESFAPGTPGCNQPACTPGAGGANPPIPEPIAQSGQITRAQIDYEYNCWGDYTSPMAGTDWAVDGLTTTNEQDIPPCTDASDPDIYDLIADVAPSGANGHSQWTIDEMLPCNIAASDSATVTGDVWVDCADFIVEGDVVINGNVIFEGNVHVKSDGSLEINNSPGWAVFRNGRFKKDGQADLILQETAVYLSNTSWIEIAGGNLGVLRWVAPESAEFENLALWSDSPLTHFWSGQGDLTMEGVFFTPWATADYSGTSGQNQTDAQWVADKLVARGQGKLTITPKFEFPLKLDNTPRTTIIR
jgi:hypothetical protein